MPPTTTSGGALRVTLLSPCYWPEVRRGGERLVHDLATGLLARGHHASLITSHPGRTRRTVEEGLPIARVRRPPGGPLERGRLEDHLTHVPLSYRALRRESPQIAHAVFPTDALAATRWSRRTGRPAVLTYLGIPDAPGLDWRRLRRTITRRVVERSAAVVALSRAAADAFGDQLGIEAVVIAPGVDLEAFAPRAQRAEAPTVFCAASLGEPRKRVDLLLAAFELVRRERPDARLLLSRPGDPAIAARAGLPRLGVELVDVDDTSALAATYGRAWVTALPSFGEAFGLVLAESLACGTPGVATDDGGMREVVDRPAVGRLFSGGPEELAGALLEGLALAVAPGTRAACRERAAAFSLERTVDAYVALYRRLLDP